LAFGEETPHTEGRRSKRRKPQSERLLGKRRKRFAEDSSSSGDGNDSDSSEPGRKKDKKLVFLSKSVLEKLRERSMMTGTMVIAHIQISLDCS